MGPFDVNVWESTTVNGMSPPVKPFALAVERNPFPLKVKSTGEPA
jgi:hypothetical protein